MRNEALVCVLLLGGAARANDAEAARALAQRGTEAYRQGRFHEAKQAYSHAYDLDPRPALLFDIAQCARGEHDFAGAASFYRLYLDAYPKQEAPNGPMVRDLLAEMEAHLSDAGSRAFAEPSLVQPQVGAKPLPALVPRAEVPPPLIPSSTSLQPAAPEEPLYKKWWVWAGVGAVVTGIVVTAIAVNEPQPRGASLGSASLRGGQ